MRQRTPHRHGPRRVHDRIVRDVGSLSVSSSTAKYFYGELLGVANDLSLAITGPFVIKDNQVKPR
jgi:hypothetical protein